jgi:hypothetical protein
MLWWLILLNLANLATKWIERFNLDQLKQNYFNLIFFKKNKYYYFEKK